MNNELTFDGVKTYATEANLRKALTRLGLDTHGSRYFVTRTPEGRWTAVFLASEYLRVHGGYVLFASVHGFISV